MKHLLSSLIPAVMVALLCGCRSASEKQAADDIFYEDPAIRENARCTLEKISSDTAVESIGLAYTVTHDDDWKIALVNSLGARKNPAALTYLLPIPEGDTPLSNAVARAVGGMATPESTQALIAFLNANVTDDALIALLDEAEALARAHCNNAELWKLLYEKSTGAAVETAIKTAALTWQFRYPDTAPEKMFGNDLQGFIGHERELVAAIKNFAQVDCTEFRSYLLDKTTAPRSVINYLAAHFDKLPLEAKPQLLALLTLTKDRTFATLARNALKAKQENIRIAAVAALNKLGYPSDYDLLFKQLLTDTPAVKNAIKGTFAANLPYWDTLFAQALSAANTPDNDRKDILEYAVAIAIAGDKTFKAITTKKALQPFALQTLEKWRDPAKAEAILHYSENLNSPFERAKLLTTVIRLTAVKSFPTAEDKLRAFASLLDVCERDAERLRIIDSIADIHNFKAINLLQFLSSNSVTGQAAIVAASRCAVAIEGADPLVIEDILNKNLQMASGDSKKECQKLLQEYCKSFMFIKKWQVSPAYTAKNNKGQDDCKAAHLAVFPPEKADDTTTTWIDAAAVPKYGTDGVVEIHKILGGVQRTAYLRTVINVTEDRDVRLEFGTDDMLKVWLNGEIILDQPVYQALVVAKYAVNVTLKKGDNVLMLKVSQGSNDWEACCSVKAPDGSFLK